MAIQKDNYIYVTAAEFEAFVALLKETYSKVSTIKNRSERRVYLTLDSGVEVKFSLTGLVNVPGKGLCYAQERDTAEMLRYNSEMYSVISLTGKGSRSREACQEAKMIHSLMLDPQELTGETRITLAK